MALSMYQASVPVYIKLLNGLAGCLKKAAAHYAEKKYDEASLLNYRLYPDMFPLSKQVQVVTDQAKGCAARLAVWRLRGFAARALVGAVVSVRRPNQIAAARAHLRHARFTLRTAPTHPANSIRAGTTTPLASGSPQHQVRPPFPKPWR